MAPRPAALHESALSPQEYEEYAPLLSAFEASSLAQRLPPQEVWDWLLQWLGDVDSRNERDLLSFFRLPSSASATTPTYPPSAQTLLALTRLYAHSRATRHLTRDLLFVATDPATFIATPKAPRPPLASRPSASAKEAAPPIPPQRSASLQHKSTNPFRRAGAPLAVQTGVGLGRAPQQLPTPPPASPSSVPAPVHQRSASAPHATSPTQGSIASKEAPPLPPPKRIVSVKSAQQGEGAPARTNPFFPPTKTDGALPASPPASNTSSSRSQPHQPLFAEPSSNAIPPTPAASSVAGSLPPLPPRPSGSSAKQAPAPPSPSTKPPMAPRRSTKPGLDAPPTPARQAPVSASVSARPQSAQPRLSIISSSSASSLQPKPVSESQRHPPPPSKLTSSTHIGIGSSVRIIDEPSSSSGGQSGSSSVTGGSGTVRGRMTRSNSGLSTGAQSSGGGSGATAGVIGQQGYSYEAPRSSPRKESRAGGRAGGRSRSRSNSKRSSGIEQLLKRDEDDDAQSVNSDIHSVRTEPLASTSIFPSFSSASVHPPAPSSPDGTFQPTGTLARSKTLGDKPFRPPPPPRRRVEENPFEPSASAIGLGRASSIGHQHHQRTSSLTSRASSSSATVTGKGPKEFGSEVASFLVQGAREGARAAEGLVRRTSGVRKPSGPAERERLVDRQTSSDDDEDEEEGTPLGVEEEAEMLGAEDEDEMEVRMKELERGVRETVEKGQWRPLGES